MFVRDPPSQQTLVKLQTTIDNEVYYLYSTVDSIELVDEYTKNEAYNNRVSDPEEWERFHFDIYGPYY